MTLTNNTQNVTSKNKRYILKDQMKFARKIRFSMGDKIRIIKKEKTFEKRFTLRWTEEKRTLAVFSI